MFQEMVGLSRLAEAEFPDRHVVVHIGWPADSWGDPLASGVKLLNLQPLPRLFPEFAFIMRYTTKVPLAEKKVLAKREAGEKTKKKTDTP